MTFSAKPTRLSSRERHRARFARDAVYAEFGSHGRALDYDGFVDRPPRRLLGAAHVRFRP